MKPRIVISRCLEFEPVRYNGQNIPFPLISKLQKYVDFIKICPEVEIGLGVPRDPIRLVQDNGVKLIQPSTGKDLTKQMQEYSEKKVNKFGQIEGIILKYGSPSCGPHNVKIYQGDRKPLKGPGMFAEKLINSYPHTPHEDEGRLRNFTIREHFLTKIFTLARFRDIKTKSDFVKFQQDHKYLLMGYNQNGQKKLGKIVATNQDKSQYEIELMQVMKNPPKFTNMINVLMHLFGGISKELSEDERKFFLNKLEEYKDERIPLSVCTNILYSWALRFNNQYMLNQVLFEPFPKDLIEVSDSGKGRI